MSFLELLPSHDTPGSLAQSRHFLNSCPVMTHLNLLPSHVTSESISQSCLFLNSCPVMSLLELLHSHVTPGALADEVTRPCGELLSLSNVIFVHSSSCGFRFTSRVSCSVGDSLREPALLFVVKKLSPAAYCFRILPAGVEENIFHQISEPAVALVLSRITIATTSHQLVKTDLSHDGLNPAHVPCWRVNNPMLGDFCFPMIGRGDVEGSIVAMNAWPPQASYPCGNFSDTSC